MNIYYALPGSPYLDLVADFVLRRYASSLNSIKIIVPNTITCSSLQQLFLHKAENGATLLPNIMPLSAIASESDASYKIPAESIEVISYLEQKLLLIDIILKYQGFNSKRLSLLQASYLSDQLIRLFYEISEADVDITKLPGIIEIDGAAHWIVTTDFLLYAHDLWKEAIRNNGKIDAISHQKAMFEIEEQENKSITIMVGVVSDAKFIKQFIKHLSMSDKGVVILPPFNPAELSHELLPISPLYNIKEMIDYLGVSVSELKCLDVGQKNISAPNVQYLKVNNFMEEAELVALLSLDARPDDKVAIVSNNRDLVNLCEISLNKYGRHLQNMHGRPLLLTKSVDFILLVAEVALLKDINKFIALIKTPFLLSDMVYRFEIDILRRPIDDIKQLIEIVDFTEHEEMRVWFKSLWDVLIILHDFQDKKSKFIDIVDAHVKVVNLLAPDLWQGEEGEAISEFFREIIEAGSNLEFIETEFYPDLIRQLISPAKFFPKMNSNIVAISPRDAALLNYDRMIIMDCNEGSFPRDKMVDPWMNDKMRSSVGLSVGDKAIGLSHYYFSLLVQKKEVYITRALSPKSGDNIESRFLSELLLKHKSNLPKYDWTAAVKNTFASEVKSNPEALGVAKNFVHNISATNIELLMRNPYGFYAKRILNLSKLDDINREVSMADFGTIIHNIIALYTENYDIKIIDKHQQMLEIGRKVFDEFYSHKKSRSWWQKFVNIAESFIKWDEARRPELEKVYAEIYGEVILNISGHNVKVTAIADRVELTKDGDLRILDYKTGVVPTKQDVNSGLSPQLIVAAIIASSGGFKGVPLLVPNKLIYVKITNIKQRSSSETSFDLTPEDLMLHKEALIKLLEYYVNSPVFISTPSPKHEPKYNDYKHLAR